MSHDYREEVAVRVSIAIIDRSADDYGSRFTEKDYPEGHDPLALV